MLQKDKQIYKFSAYGFLKNLRFFDPFIILFFREMGISFLEIGILFSVRSIFTIIFEIPTGIVADSYGKKNSMILSFVSYIISFIIFYSFPQYGFYIVAMILYSAGEAFRSGTHKAMILTYLKLKNWNDLKVEYYGYTRSWSQKGSAISALIAGAIVLFSGQYKFVFLASIVPYIMELFLIISYPNELNDHEKSVEEVPFFKKIYNDYKVTIKNFIKTFNNIHLVKSIFNSSLYDGLFKTIKDYIQPMLKMYALTLPVIFFTKEKQGIIVISVVYFILYLLTSVASKHSATISKKFTSIISAVNISYLLGVFLSIAVGVFYLFNYKVVAILIFIFLYAFQNFRRPVNVRIISDNISYKVLSSGLSTESFLKNIIQVILAPLLGILVDAYGVGNGIAIISCIVFLLYPFIKLKSR